MPLRRFAAFPLLACVALATACGAGSAHPAAKVVTPTAVPSTTNLTQVAKAPPPVYPLTGMPVTNAARAHRPAVSVKIDNVAGAFPQAGLNSADIVADVLVEGGLTRLFATWQSQDAPLIGPVRSARPVDADLLRLYGPSIFAYSGAAAGEIAPTIAHGEATRVSWDAYPGAYFREGGYISPHNVFTSTALLYAQAKALSPSLRAPRPVFTYSAGTPNWPHVRHVALTFSPVANSGWTWTGRGYVRTQNGAVDLVAGGQAVSATNVVIMSVDVLGTNIVDAAGNVDPLDVVLGHGHVWVMRNGRGISGTWSRPNDAAPMVLRMANGQIISLAPGRTWLELLPVPHQPVFS